MLISTEDQARRRTRAPLNAVLLTGLVLALVALLVTQRSAQTEPVAAPACTKSWDRGAGTDAWQTPANWSGDTLPGSSDHVCLTADAVSGNAVTVSTGTQTISSIQLDPAGNDEKLLLSGGRLDINSATDESTIARIEHGNGDLGGTAAINVADYVWTGGGTQDTPNGPFSTHGTGQTTITNSLTIDRPDTNPGLDASNPDKPLNRLLRIATGASATHGGNNGSSGNIGRLNIHGLSGRLEIANGASYTLTRDQDIVGGARGVSVASGGSLTKPLGHGGDSFVDPPLDNDGTMLVREGRLLIRGAGGSHTGAFDIDGGATLHFNAGGGHVLTGAQGIRDTGAGSGQTTVGFSGSIVDMQAPNGADRTLVTGGRVDFNTAQTLPLVEQGNGDLGGTATINVADYVWTGGGTQDTPNGAFSTAGSGQTTITNSLTIDRPDSNTNIDAHNPDKPLNRILRIATGASATHGGNNGSSGNIGRLNIHGLSGRLEIASGASYTLERDQDIVGSARGVDVDGSLTKPLGHGGDSFVDPPLDNDGTMLVRQGRLLIRGAGGSHTGAFDIDGGAALHFNGGGGHVLTGAQGIRDTGAGSGQTTVGFSGSIVDMQAPNGADKTTISAGRVDFNTPQTLPLVEQGNGDLGGTAAINVADYVWTGGGTQDTPNGAFSTAGPGQTTITNSLTIDRPDSNTNIDAHNPDKLLNRVLRIAAGATATHRGNNGSSGNIGRLNIHGLSGRLDISNGASYALEANQDIVGSARGVENDGTLTKATGTGESLVQPPLDQDGTFTVDSGALAISGGGHNTHSGTFDVAGGAALRWNGGGHTLSSANGIRRKPGDASPALTQGSFGGSSITINAPYNLDTTSVSSGHAVFNGSTSTGPLTLSGGRADFNTPLSTPSINQTNGDLGGSSTVTTPTYTWTGGGQQDTPPGPSNTAGSGETVVTSSLTIDRPDAQTGIDAHNPDKLLNRHLRLPSGASATHQGNNGSSSHLGRLHIHSVSGLLTIENGASYTLEANQDIVGSPTRGVENDGTLTKASGAGESTVQPPLDQDGTFTVDSGALAISGGGHNTHSGTFNVAGGAALRWNGGGHTLSSANGIRRKPGDTSSALTQGSFGGSSITINAPYSLETTTVSGGHAVFNGSTSTGPLTLTGGRADFNTPLSTPSINQTNGDLGGSSTVTTPTYTWTGSGQQDTPAGPFSTAGTGETVVTGSLTIDRAPDGNPGLDAHNPDKLLNRELRLPAGAVATHRGNNGSSAHLGRLHIHNISGLLTIENGASYTLEANQDIVGIPTQGVDNDGTLRKTSAGGGTGLSHIQPNFAQDGTLEVQTGTLRTDSLTSYNSSTDTLGGGRYVVAGTLAIADGEIDVNAARLELDGPGAQVDNWHTTAANDGLNTFATNAASGDFRLLGGKNLTTPTTGGGPFTNNGSVTVGSGSTLTATGGFQNNGTLRGNGTVGPSVTNAGTVSPGTSAGVLSVNGNYTQTSAGTLLVEVAGSSPGTNLDRLAVSGAAVLDGTLQVDHGVFAPGADGTEYPFLTHASRTGEFDAVTGNVIDADLHFDPVYDHTGDTYLRVTIAGLPNLSIEQAEAVDEGDAAELTVSLSEPTRRIVNVDYATANGTAGNSDYTGSSGRFTFAAGEITKTVSVPAASDALDEDAETVDVTLSAPSGSGAPDLNAVMPVDPTGTVTINDDDPLPALSTRHEDEFTVEEGDTSDVTVNVPVRLSAPTGRHVEVDYETAAGSASAGSDYTTAGGTVSFDPGDPTTKTVPITVKGDTADEPGETFSFRLSDPSNATLDSAQDEATIRIVDNDASSSPNPTPSLSIDDVRVAEGDSGSANARFRLTLSNSPSSPVSIDYATQDAGAEGGSDYDSTSGTASFAAGDRTATVDVPVRGDTSDENDEAFDLVLSNESGATLGDSSGRGTIADDDEPAPAPQVILQPQPEPQPEPEPQVQATPEDRAIQFSDARTRTFGFNIVGVPVTCPQVAVNNCQGVLKLQIPERPKGKRARGAARTKPGTVLGRAQFFVRQDRSRILSVRLYGSGQQLFRKRKKLVVDAIAVMRDGTQVKKRLKFKAPKK